MFLHCGTKIIIMVCEDHRIVLSRYEPGDSVTDEREEVIVKLNWNGFEINKKIILQISETTTEMEISMKLL